MKKLIFISLMSIVVLSSYGQCKYANKRIVKGLSKQITTQIKLMTKPKIIFKKMSQSSMGAFFINEKNEYFLALILKRENSSSKFEILEKQKLLINFENNTNLTLLSFENVESRMLALFKQEIWAVYKIDKEQLKLFSENPLSKLKIYFVSKKKLSNTFKDEDGNYFEFVVKLKVFKSNLKNQADCILQSK